MELCIHEDVKDLLNKLNEIAPSLIFGGYIRDLMSNKIPSDVDIITNISIDSLEKMFSDCEKSQRRTTISGHDVFSFKLVNREKIFIEIVSSKNNVFHKAKEADYTINSLLHNGDKLFDFSGGIDDFQNKMIKEIDISIIQEDLKTRPYLWLKTIRLCSSLDFRLSNNVFFELEKNKQLIETINPSIMQTEGHKTLNGDNPFIALYYLSKMGYIQSFDFDSIQYQNVMMQPHQKLCYLSLISNKKTVDDFTRFYQFPNFIIERYEELFTAFHREEKLSSRLRNQLIPIKKLL